MLHTPSRAFAGASPLALAAAGELWTPKKPALIRARTRDNMMTFDARTVDSTGAFLIGELERLDQTLHDPLVAVTWSRDIQLREDVTIADEVSSFTNSTFASTGGARPNGKSWIGKDANAIASMQLDINKIPQPLTLWGEMISYTIPELESAMKLGRPVDAQKYEGLKLKHQMDIDEMVYTGDTDLNYYGLTNNTTGVTPQNYANGASGFPQWAQKTADEVLADINTALTTTWANAGWAVMPSDFLIPPLQFGYLTTAKVSQAGNMSLLKYILENNITTQSGGKLSIRPLKWLIGRGAGGTPGVLNTVDRSVIYTNDKLRIRYPMTPLQRTPLEYRSLYQNTTYYGRLGVVEFVYPETVSYFDGL
jgi:hypothetical protein